LLNFVLRLDEEKINNDELKFKIKMTLYYFSVVFVSNLLMFFMMTYNLGIILAILFGNVVGFWLFHLSHVPKNKPVAEVLNEK